MPNIREIKGYHLSRDYEKLFSLMQKQSIVCIVGVDARNSWGSGGFPEPCALFAEGAVVEIICWLWRAILFRPEPLTYGARKRGYGKR